MSKKHFQALALALAAIRPNEAWLNKRQQWEKDVNAVADVCAAHNHAFNRGTFIQWCEEKEECV